MQRRSARSRRSIQRHRRLGTLHQNLPLLLLDSRAVPQKNGADVALGCAAAVAAGLSAAFAEQHAKWPVSTLGVAQSGREEA